MAKHIFVTGGVVSSLGKGLTAASIGMLLESRGLKVRLQKFDPYINVDAGTMNPFQHGEVYVTDDGAETDLDLGHYERFTHTIVDRHSNYTTGKIYNTVISKERKGEYLGNTVQVVPHITNEIKEAIKSVSAADVDVVITEIGGTVGDIEGLPFLEGIRQFGFDVGKQNVLFIHLTLLPYLRASDEIKTKPTQHSVGKLREIGIQPDILICRTEKPITEEMKSKIALFCNVEITSVIEEKDVDFSIYEVPLVFIEQGLDTLILKKLRMRTKRRDISRWRELIKTLLKPKHEVEIAIVGKYIRLQDSYKSIYEALIHGGIENNCRVRLRKIHAEDIETQGAKKLLKGVNAILVPGGFGERGIEGKIQAINHARMNKIPFFGICLGMQCATIEFARNVCKMKDAHSTEFRPDTPFPVVSLMEEQKKISNMGGTMRLGAYPCKIAKKTHAHKAYQKTNIAERHRHRYEFTNRYLEEFKKHGLIFSGICPSGELVEIIEVKDHPWFTAVQFHPEFKSKPTGAHPLFRDFVASALKSKNET
ncbi:MAG: CTP synthase [Planctomycetes bacterium]|nr:CTP synthase [Planctomycetota bacterium]